ncbi:EVE domain-containing protein [Spirulina subsalsa]|uniref:EVE domain-containing protein n=1 Tax=Spirulina subsalsa TaxID=54311 RepID=UPI0003069B64|nr:EVE domain-containing protein [Spirulina subsalsa]
MNYWLVKSEPLTYSIDQFKQDKTTLWDGVRNYQARNFLQAMTLGDLAFFYHSNTKIPGIVGLGKVTQTQVIDPTQFNPQSPYFDPKSSPDSPRWFTVELIYLKTFVQVISLAHLKAQFEGEDFALVKKGNRLSVMPVPEKIAEKILQWGEK